MRRGVLAVLAALVAVTLVVVGTAAECPPATTDTTPAPPATDACLATLTATGGLPFCQDGQASPADMNVMLPASPPQDPDSSSTVSKLNAGTHGAALYEYGTRVYASQSTDPQRSIVCTQTGWGACPLTGKTVAVNPKWKPSSGSDHAMVVVDFQQRRVYDFWRVDVNTDGTVKTYSDGTIHTAWGDVTSLDGSGQAHEATGSGLSHLYGMVRVFEAQQALSGDVQHAIPHALHFSTNANCTTFRAPATKADGHTAPPCVQEGTRVYLDASANCDFDPARPIEEAVCYALKQYGAFDTDSGGAPFTVGFEGPTNGIPGGSGADPYVTGGLKWDYYDMSHIPWAKLKVVG